VVEIHGRVGAPESPLKVFARDDLSGVFEQDGKELKRLRLNPYSDTGTAEFSSS
jgi:hypothetical protein